MCLPTISLPSNVEGSEKRKICHVKVLMHLSMRTQCVKHVIIFLSSFLFVSAVHPPGAAAERCRRRHPLLFPIVFLIFTAHSSLLWVSGPVRVLPGHPQHPAQQDTVIAGGGLPVARVHHEEANGTEQTCQRCRSGSVSDMSHCSHICSGKPAKILCIYVDLKFNFRYFFPFKTHLGGESFRACLRACFHLC